MKIYCSGIGGIGLSAYAALQQASGHRVSGSDRSSSALTEDLKSQGIAVTTNQYGSQIPDDTDLFVFSEAIPDDAPERRRAAELGIRSISYFAALGELSKDFHVIAVCGTHGKSSTTAMAAKVLCDAGLDPTVVVGTKVPQLNGRNWRKGSSDLFLLEACEYRGSFLHLHPDIIVLTNVDWDHVDAYPSEEQYRKAYEEFAIRLPKDGAFITHMNDPHCRILGYSDTRILVDADTFPLPELSVPGRHMQENAQLVVALADHLRIEATESLKGFTGTWRRFELKGFYPLPTTHYPLPVIDDYAHHPAEIAATIAAAREVYPDKRIVCLFQPHMHNRTCQFYNEFLIAFDGADLVVVTDVYDARASVDTQRIDIKQFTEDIHAESLYGGTLDAAKDLLCCSILQQNDVLLVMGAGDSTRVAEELVAPSL